MNSDPTDYRAPYYRSYVSGFSARNATGSRWNDEAYMQWCDEHYGSWLASAPRDGPVLELGAGDGSMLAYLQSAGFRDIAGIDISEEQAQIARRLGRPVRVQDVFEALSVPAGTLSGIVALDFLEHFTKAEVGELLGLAASALRPGGFLLVRTPNGQGIFSGQIVYGDLTHATIFTPGSLHQALDVAGFTDVRFSEATFVRRGLRGRLRGIGWDLIRAAANVVRRVQAGKTQEIWSENLLCYARTETRPGG
ncbi:MAG: hypothetical protein QOK16_2056 [Solirubrobacteraceae bacterium]|jgi:SAM-dependent methyltransferase|nr:hypothetical protein [Solirubrobacteraceae bacterium]